MKIIFKALASLSLILFSINLVSCGNSKQELTGNQKFVNSFEKSINTRWTEQDAVSSKTKEDIAQKTKVILEKEISTLEETLPGVDDPILKKNGIDYIEGVKLQIEAFLTNDYILQADYQTESDSLRKPALMSMVETYGVKIKPEHEQTYKDFKAAATIISNENNARKFAEELGANMVLEQNTSDSGSVTYTALVENTSEFDFSSISYDVKFKDKDGVTVDSSSIYLSNFAKNDKHKVELSSYKENEFETILIELDYVSIK